MEGTLGTILAVGFNFAPRFWAFCHGQLLPIAENTSLFSLLGNTFGGDGRTTFALPDLKGRSIVGVGQGKGKGLDPVRYGQIGPGYVTLTTENLPAHSHTAALHAELGTATKKNPAGNMLAGSTIYNAPDPADNKIMSDDSIAVGNTGGGHPFPVQGPYLGLHYVICVNGAYPSRN